MSVLQCCYFLSAVLFSAKMSVMIANSKIAKNKKPKPKKQQKEKKQNNVFAQLEQANKDIKNLHEYELGVLARLEESQNREKQLYDRFIQIAKTHHQSIFGASVESREMLQDLENKRAIFHRHPNHVFATLMHILDHYDNKLLTKKK